MPRTLPTELEEALENNSFSDVYIRAFFYVNFSDTTPTFTMTTVKKYKLTGKTLSIEGIYDYLVDDFDQLGFVVLRRGVVANGTPSYIDTARFAIRKGKVDGDFLKVESYILADHNATFTTTNTRNAIDNFSAEYGFIAVGPADGIYNNQFNSTGLVFVNHPEQFEVMLKQKFINFCENGFNIVTGNNQLRFYDVRLDPWNNYPTTITLENIVERIFNQPVIFSVGLRWVDENGVVQGYSGTELPIFNIGFLKTGDTLPTQPGIWTTNKIKAIPMSVTPIILPMNLNYQDGDLLQFVGHKGVIATGSILVTEYLDLKENPSWGIKIEFWDYIGNTEGGSLSNRDIIRYASIDPSEFENNLDETITNVQLLAKAVDVLNLGGESYTPPATTAANDFQLGDGAGSWVTKTLAQVVTILRTALDSAYSLAGHTHAASGIPADGWIPVTLGSPTRTSNTAFTTTTNLTSLWQKGYKLKFTDTTTKYAYEVAMSAYSAGSMTVTISGNTLVGNPSAFYYSPIENPLDFPTSFSFTSTPSRSGTPYTNNPILNSASYRIIGNKVEGSIDFTMAASAGGTGEVYWSPPTTIATNRYGFGIEVAATAMPFTVGSPPSAQVLVFYDIAPPAVISTTGGYRYVGSFEFLI